LRLANPARQGGSLDPKPAAMLGCAYGAKVCCPETRCPRRVPQPGREEERALFEARLDGIFDPVQAPSCARPRPGEERRGSAPADEGFGCPSLWVLSLGQARESTSPKRGETHCEKTHRRKTGTTLLDFTWFSRIRGPGSDRGKCKRSRSGENSCSSISRSLRRKGQTKTQQPAITPHHSLYIDSIYSF